MSDSEEQEKRAKLLRARIDEMMSPKPGANDRGKETPREFTDRKAREASQRKEKGK